MAGAQAAWSVGTRLARYGAMVAILTAAAALWNRTRFKDEDEKLRRTGRRGYLIVGRREDGEPICINVQAALRDWMGNVGLADPAATVRDVQEGRATGREVAGKMARAFPNRLMNGLYPWYKMPFELAARKSFYPDMANPTPIRDVGEYLSQQAGLRSVYGNLSGKPIPKELRGWGGIARSWMVYFTDTGEASYWAARRDVANWMRVNKIPASEGFSGSERSDALYNVKKALQYGDAAARDKYVKKYYLSGGTAKGMAQSLQEMHPLSSLPAQYRNAYLQSLTGERRQNASAAIDYWNAARLDRNSGAQHEGRTQ
jgi:hypothetical protein